MSRNPMYISYSGCLIGCPLLTQSIIFTLDSDGV
ncbi:MAG: hypothetical protein KHX41_00470 [Coprobacillus cateniformis]|nr:hypothetical protein [Coprobacillus cateniformis]PWM85460.1 MAG: hypothetical protein DBY29_08575 [Coprobacillus sp.]MVX29754.1 hypothetical protein [Coprobacillus cateniformis]RGO18333.1 hypothetical protein DXB30_02215 [Coprobacillus cateniformis]RGO26387.1 hypothetical protein DXB26_03710 [Coprobacillus cateniformis]